MPYNLDPKKADLERIMPGKYNERVLNNMTPYQIDQAYAKNINVQEGYSYTKSSIVDKQKAKEVYFMIGGILGCIGGFLTFFVTYYYCIVTYGFLFGFGFGWLPSCMLAVIVAYAVFLLWGPMLIVAIFLLNRYHLT